MTRLRRHGEHGARLRESVVMREISPEEQAAKARLAHIYKAAMRLRWATPDEDDPVADLLYAIGREASGEVARLILTRNMREDEATAAVLSQPPYMEAERLAVRVLERWAPAP
jgi:hypothetical protein